MNPGCGPVPDAATYRGQPDTMSLASHNLTDSRGNRNTKA